jgi:hypothetical protein
MVFFFSLVVNVADIVNMCLMLFIYKIIFKILRRMQFICDANQTATDVIIYSSSLTFCLLIETQKETSNECTKVFSFHTGNLPNQCLVEAVC